MLRIRNTVAMPSSRMMSSPSGPIRPSGTLSPKPPSASSCVPTPPSLRAHRFGDAGEQVVLGRRAVHERAHEFVVLGRPDRALDLQGCLEPEPVRVYLGRVRP